MVDLYEFFVELTPRFSSNIRSEILLIERIFWTTLIDNRKPTPPVPATVVEE
jgi:hypothetical protein